jgi:hypothetical protein
MKGADGADQYLSYCTILKETIKLEQSACALSNQLCIVQFLSSAQVAESRIETEVQFTST